MYLSGDGRSEKGAMDGWLCYTCYSRNSSLELIMSDPRGFLCGGA